MKQTSKKLQFTLAVALFLCILANVIGTVYVPDQPDAAVPVSVPSTPARG